MDPARASTLLQRYTATRCGGSFRELVEGHAALVYSAALRITGDSGLAEDVMQNVFAGLAAKPNAVRDGKGLAAWLHRAASGRAVDIVRTESRRRQREQHATHMNDSTSTGPDPLWEAAAPVIDSALGSLSATDRQLLLLRFWQRQDMRCIGEAFGLSDDAAQKRIGRALEKLRAFLMRRGITGTASALSVALMASASAAPPAAAVARISAAALALSQTAPSAAAGTILTKTIAMTTKSKVAVTTAAACVAIGAPVYYQQRQINELREENASLRAGAGLRKAILPVAEENPGVPNSSTKAGSAEVASSTTVPTDTGITGRTRHLGGRSASGPGRNLEMGPRRATGGTVEVEGGLSTSFIPAGGPDLLGMGSLEGASRTVPMVAGKVHWDHGQATGAPDTKTAGDYPTAWAPKNPRSGEQWLSLGYDKPVEIKEINIHETHSPGAISRVAAQMPDGSEKILWQGTATKPHDGEDSLETSLPVPRGTTANQIKVYVDTNRVGSWPEIDAVELVGTNGSRQWASSSSASSSYSEHYSPTPVTVAGGSGEQVITQGADGRVLEVRPGASQPAAAPSGAASSP